VREHCGGRVDLQEGGRLRIFKVGGSTPVEFLLEPVVGEGVRQRNVEKDERMSGPRGCVCHSVEDLL